MKKIVFSLLILVSVFMLAGCEKAKYDVLKGTWEATAENQRIHEFDTYTTGGEEDYYLECDGKGHYDLTSASGNRANASYSIKNNTVTFYDEGRQVLGICKINDNELDCSEKSYYAFKYIKIEE